MAKKLFTHDDVLGQDTVSRGYTTLSKAKPEQLSKVGDWLEGNGYKLTGGKPTAFGMLVGHSLPTTFMEAQVIAQRWFSAEGITLRLFSADTCWHSTKGKKAIIHKAKGLQKYNANYHNVQAYHDMVCATHKSVWDRTNCLKTCQQGLWRVETGKWLWTSATKARFTFEVAKKKTKVKKQTPVEKLIEDHEVETHNEEVIA